MGKRKKYRDDPNQPTCVNRGCNKKVHVIEYKKGIPTYRSVCFNCHEAGWNDKVNLKPGVVSIKKDYCENIDGRLKFKCVERKYCSGDLHLDHKDGDHYNNIEENIQTLCKHCHIEKTKQNGDHKFRGDNQFFGREKVKKESLEITFDTKDHDFF